MWKRFVACLEDLKKRLTVCGMLNTLTYLKKAEEYLHRWQCLEMHSKSNRSIELKDKVVGHAWKSEGTKRSMNIFGRSFGSYEIDKNEPVYFGYTSDKEIVEQFMEKTVAEYGLKKYEIYPVGGIIGTHVGPGCIAISFAKKENFS